MNDCAVVTAVVATNGYDVLIAFMLCVAIVIAVFIFAVVTS